MKQEYIGTELELFENAHNWKRYWFNAIRPYIGDSVLDVGAGIGSTAKLFSDVKLDCYLAVEPDVDNVKIMQDKASSRIFNSSFKSINGCVEDLDSSVLFDTILYIDVLEHILDDRGELEAVSKHLLPGGRLIILSPAHQWLFSPFDESVGHHRRYNKKTLMMAKPDGLVLDRLCYLDSIGVMASASNRLLLRSSSPSMDQIMIWNNYMVPVSVYIDRLTGFLFGKTILGVFKRPVDGANN